MSAGPTKDINGMGSCSLKKTLIIITHKYSTIKNCDLVYEFKNGEVFDITSEHKS
jgi:ABC-type bacteriocin/lantibiotic exporter with double-glycine peptidase domain